ncbi:pesticin C-terminus-like muramidase [Acidithiobacillus sulfuriphilus]|uniref:Pesticin C-terminal domain-containing protein n=2 Tax=Acidithiobacillus sulfuriphilus TaxID=1867749 RepID=A0A3M8QNL9_9PROT|nr:pesticin C-terminus-like muramidase [Acidithiobacillus sulfuriphilus]RNF57859.1 hypothetical protein EC580_13795 [Acidithiobacillus sulfuriphilus]
MHSTPARSDAAPIASLLFLTLGAASPADAASFDCRNPGNPTEKTICADPQLDRLDREHNRIAKELIMRMQQAGNYTQALQYVQDSEEKWKNERNACRTDPFCITDAYARRLAVLNTCFYPDRPANTAPAQSTPGATVCAKGNKVDFAFIKKNEGAMLDFYVPGYHATDMATGRNLGKAKPNKAKNGKETEPQPIQNSGVTVGVGVDLGQQTEDSLRRAMHQEAKDYGKPDDVKIDDILDRVKPFLSPLRRMDAANALEDYKKNRGKYPSLTSAEARFLSSAVQHDYTQQAADVFNKSQRQEPPMDFWSLPAEAQTVLTDITYHHGRGGLTRVRSLLHQGKWQEAVDKLRQIAPSSGFKERMLKRATLLQKAIDGDSLPKDGNPCAPKQAAADRRTALWERVRRLWWA